MKVIWLIVLEAFRLHGDEKKGIKMFTYESGEFPLKGDFGEDIHVEINRVTGVIKSQKNNDKDIYMGSFQVIGKTKKSVMRVVELANILLANFMVPPEQDQQK